MKAMHALAPDYKIEVDYCSLRITGKKSLPRGQSSPGNLHSVQQPSKGCLQILHWSSTATPVHFQTAIPPQPASNSNINNIVRCKTTDRKVLFYFQIIKQLA
jgi:hypothetical protein